MKYNPKIHNRRSIRLPEYDYSQEGFYFITICTQHKLPLFGKIENNQITLNNAGKMIELSWKSLPKRFTQIELDRYIVMPNHFHGIINIVGATLVVAQNESEHKRAGTRPAPTKKSVSNIVGAFKSITTNEYIKNVKQNNWAPFNKTIWQRNYYEHVIRNEVSLQQIREYIVNNPSQWEKDDLFVT